MSCGVVASCSWAAGIGFNLGTPEDSGVAFSLAAELTSTRSTFVAIG